MKKINVLLGVLMCCSGMLCAQTLTGTVSDTGGPLLGATILIKGTNNGVTTDFDGRYSLDEVTSGRILVVRFLGYITQEINIAGQSLINITLVEDSTKLDEVVVIGYGTQSRSAVTGAISTITTEELTSNPVTTADQALQGRAAGVTVLNSGSPGSGAVVRIRGLGTMNNNNALFVIDGVITDNMNFLNPNDIESVNILKDASTTAIYGSRGSNGVVMIKTKRGSRSKKIDVSFNSYIGTQTTPNRYDLLNTDQYLEYLLDAFGTTPTSPSSTSGVNTDWQDEIFQNGITKNYDLSLSGGSENSRYRFSAGYIDQEGVVIETGYDRYSFGANSDFSIGKVKFGESLNLSFSSQNPVNSSGGRTLLEHTIKAAPYFKVRNPNNLGGFQGSNTASDFQDAENPVRVQTLGERISKTTSIVGNIFGEWEITDGLKYKSQVGLEYGAWSFNEFIPSYNDDSIGTTNSANFASISKSKGTYQTVILTNSLNYKKTFNDVHNFELLILAEKNNAKNTALNASSQNFITDEVQEILNGATNNSSTNETNRIGYLGRLNYNFNKKYIFAASLRRDASSRFGANNRWSWFPSLALGWNISKETFMKNSGFSNLKLRGSWGIVGNDGIGDYRFSSTLNNNFFYPIGGGLAIGTTADGLANPNLKWEETTMKNIGLDFGLFNNRITGALEYFNNRSDDLLLERATPVSSGFNSGSIAENVGSVETSGFEISLGYNDHEGDFTWSTKLNFGTSKNEVLALGQTTEITGASFEGSAISRTTINESLFYFYGLEMDGIYDTQAEVDAVFTANPGQTTVQPGDVRFIDHNNDGDITSADRVKIGNPFPDITYALNANFAYKSFDLNLFVNGVSGNDIYNTTRYDLEGMSIPFNAGTAVLNRWTGPGTSHTIPRAGGAPQNYQAISSRFVEDGSFIRLKNIILGYTVSNKFISDYVSKFRIYITGQNLITLTDYSGLDPELGSSSQFELGVDRGAYPQPKSYLLGVQLSF